MAQDAAEERPRDERPGLVGGEDAVRDRAAHGVDQPPGHDHRGLGGDVRRQLARLLSAAQERDDRALDLLDQPAPVGV